MPDLEEEVEAEMEKKKGEAYLRPGDEDIESDSEVDAM
jgi:hypothetical protein